jgi:hypothetical protein
MRSHGGNGVVSQIENWYYTLTAPSKGGPALRSLPKVGVLAATEDSTERYRPLPIKPLIHPSLPGEGVWRPAAALCNQSLPRCRRLGMDACDAILENSPLGRGNPRPFEPL